jgi:predicted ester cyclase
MTMTPDYRAIAHRWFDDNWNGRREAVIDELLTPASVGHMEGGDVRGAEEFKTVRAALLGAFPDMRLVVEDIVVEGRQAVVRWSVSGTHLGDHLGFAASHRPANFRGMTWLKFEGAKIAEGWDGWNQGALLASLQAATP